MMPTLTDFWISIVITFVLTIAIYKWFGDIGLGSFPVLTFLFISVISYVATAGIHWLIIQL